MVIKNKSNLKLLIMIMILTLTIVTVGCHARTNGQLGNTPSGNLGLLPQYLRDIFALLGALLSAEKIFRGFISSAQTGFLRRIYTQRLLPRLMELSYDKEDIETVNKNLTRLNIGKLYSRDEEERRTSIRHLKIMSPSGTIFKALIKALSREESKQLRNEIILALKIHANYIDISRPS